MMCCFWQSTRLTTCTLLGVWVFACYNVPILWDNANRVGCTRKKVEKLDTRLFPWDAQSILVVISRVIYLEVSVISETRPWNYKRVLPQWFYQDVRYVICKTWVILYYVIPHCRCWCGCFEGGNFFSSSYYWWGCIYQALFSLVCWGVGCSVSSIGFTFEV